MSVYGGLNGNYGYCVIVIFFGKGEKDYRTGTGTRREASGIER